MEDKVWLERKWIRRSWERVKWMGWPFNTLMMDPLNRRTHDRATICDKSSGRRRATVGLGTVRMPSRNGGEIGEEIDRLLTNHHLQQHRTVLTKGEQSQLQQQRRVLSSNCTNYKEGGVLSSYQRRRFLSVFSGTAALSTQLQQDSHPQEKLLSVHHTNAISLRREIDSFSF